MLILHVFLVAFTGMHRFFKRVCSVTLYGLFVLLVCLPSPRLILMCQASSGNFYHWRDLVNVCKYAQPHLIRLISGGCLVTACQSTQPPLARLIGTSLGISSYRLDSIHQEGSVASWTSRLRLFCWVGVPTKVPSFISLTGRFLW